MRKNAYLRAVTSTAGGISAKLRPMRHRDRRARGEYARAQINQSGGFFRSIRNFEKRRQRGTNFLCGFGCEDIPANEKPRARSWLAWQRRDRSALARAQREA